ncbi:MAG: DNA polymerase III subunit gamma/tau, partial [Gammaproteobacteria bacterium]|nr:DNA polymerase III subunit gamma/tau [Gammaproteobacteria bacterium]
YKIYLIDEAHMLSASSFNALLKTLEEPPPHVKFLLATTEPQRLPVTVLSRCLQINLRSMDSETIGDQLTAICEGEEVEAEPGALARLARAANGSMRDALSLLDQAIAYGADAVRETDVADMLGGADQPSILHLLNALAGGDGEALLNGARELRERLADPANILAEMAAALQRLALLQTVGEGVLDEDDDAEMLAPLADALPADQVQLFYEIAVQGRSKLALAPDPGLGLEMTLLRMLAFRPVSAAKATRASAPARPAPAPIAPVAPAPEAPAAPAPEAPAAPAPESAHAPVPDAPVAPMPEAAEAPAPETPAESEARQEVSAPAAPAGDGALSPGRWPETVAGLGLEGLSGDIAEHSELVDAGDGCLRLRLDGAHENLLTEDVRQELESALLAALPAIRKVEIEIAGAGKGDTLAARNRAAERRRQQRAEEEFKADPFVQASLEIFDATIEVGSIRPVDQADGADSRAGSPGSQVEP